MLLTQPGPVQVDRADNGNPTGGLTRDSLCPPNLDNLTDPTGLRRYSQSQDREERVDNTPDRRLYNLVDNHFDDETPTSSPEFQYISIINPNYPGFQHLAHTLQYSLPQCSESESEDSNSCQTSDSCLSSNSCDSNNSCESNNSRMSDNRYLSNNSCGHTENCLSNVTHGASDSEYVSKNGGGSNSCESNNGYRQLNDYTLLETREESTSNSGVDVDANDNRTADSFDNNNAAKIEDERSLDRNGDDDSKDVTRNGGKYVSIVGDLSAEIECVMDEKLMDLTLTNQNPSDRPLNNKMADAFLSCGRDPLSLRADKYCPGGEKHKDSIAGRAPEGNKQDKTQINSQVKRSRQLQQQRHAAKQQQQQQQQQKLQEQESLDGFDVYNIETAMPVIDLDAIEAHLKAAKEEEMRRRTDREEIRRRLAMGPEPDSYPSSRASRKQSLQSRLQSGMNLQICFMNDNISDNESPTRELLSQDNLNVNVRPETTSNLALDNQVRNIDSVLQNQSTIEQANLHDNERPGTLALGLLNKPKTEEDFYACQARLQVEARLALAQAKQMAHMQMELERQNQPSSPITDVIRTALTSVGVSTPERHRRLSRRLLTGMTVAQLQVVVCRLHAQVERFNERLVGLLMTRDELHMSQDSMLVDIEDLTRYLGAKETNAVACGNTVADVQIKKPTVKKPDSTRLQRISHIIRK